jgi:hypothetical protein
VGAVAKAAQVFRSLMARSGLVSTEGHVYRRQSAPDVSATTVKQAGGRMVNAASLALRRAYTAT